MRVLLVEDEPYMAEAIRDGLRPDAIAAASRRARRPEAPPAGPRLEAIAADIAGDGDAALELLSVNAYDIAVLDRDIPGPSGDEIVERSVGVGRRMRHLL